MRSPRSPVTTSTAHATTPTAATARSQGGPAGGARPLAWIHASRATTTAPASDEQGEEEVRHHRDRMEIEQHRDATERDLGDRSERRDERDVAHPAGQAVHPPRREPRDQREDDADERHHAVAELDRGVATLLGERLVAAPRPVVAAETGRSQPHDGTARDDDPEREDGHRRELDEPARRHRPTRRP